MARHADIEYPKHIALFISNFKGSGGAERAMLNLACGLTAQGHRVDLVMACCEGHFLDRIPPSVRVLDLKVRSPRQSLSVLPRLGRDLWFWIRLLASKPHYVLGALPGLAGYLKRERPEALIAALDYPNIVAVVARDLAQVTTRVIVTAHSTLSVKMATARKPRITTKAEVDRRFYPRADAVVAISRGVADDLAQVLDLPAARISTIYNPVVSTDLASQAAEPLSHPWFAGGAPAVILAAGGFKAAKDHATLLKAFAVARAERSLRLIILGEGKLRDVLTRQAQALGIAEDLHMPGFVDNPFQYMARASLFVLSSIFEGLPMVLVEALACGCPVVSTDCPNGPKEILDHGRYGSLTPVADEKALARAILRALETPYDKSRLMARGWDFSVERATEKYLDLIRGGCNEA